MHVSIAFAGSRIHEEIEETNRTEKKYRVLDVVAVVGAHILFKRCDVYVFVSCYGNF